MPEGGNSDNKDQDKKTFIKENIVKKTSSKGEVLIKQLKFLLSAIIFGIVAMITAVVSKPYAEKYFCNEAEITSQPYTIPRDDPETTVALQNEQTENATTDETEPVEDIVNSAMEKYKYNMQDVNTLMANPSYVTNIADKAIVSVHSVKIEKDWFDNPLETAGLYSGVVIAKTDKELIVLTPEKATEDADSIKVTLDGGQELDATLKITDSLCGLSIVSVSIEALDKKSLNSIEALVLGNSYVIKRGDLLITIGSPLGITHSASYGITSYVAKGISVTDGSARLIYTDAKSNSPMGTWLINSDGELIGWATDDFIKTSDNASVFYGISDFKSILERMTNGQASPYIGIDGVEITTEMLKGGQPKGIYVTNAISDGPAYNAGIQSGDIITSVGTTETPTLNAYQSVIDLLHVDDVVKITVKRDGRGEYKEIEYEVKVAAR